MTLEFGRLSDRKPPFKYSALARVGFSDTDAQGIVYYGRYMPYFNAPVPDMALKLQELKERFGPEGEVSHIDGVSVTAEDWHMNVRPSNTSRSCGSTSRRGRVS